MTKDATQKTTSATSPSSVEHVDENQNASSSSDLSYPSRRQKLHRIAKLPEEAISKKKVAKVEKPPKKEAKLVLHTGNVLKNGRECGVVYLDTPTAKYQAVCPNLKRTNPEREYKKDREELMWSPGQETEDARSHDFRNQYWLALYRQFEGHISHDQALEHLMKNGHSIAKALETVDELLEKRGQPYEQLKMVRVLFFENLRKNQNALGSVKAKQDGQRYTAAEQKEFYQLFHYTDLGKKKRAACHHQDPLCKKLDFEPRWACSNCRKEDLPSSLIDVEKLCLICQVHQQVSGKLPDFAKVFFSDQDLKKIADWKTLEASEKKPVCRQKFEEHLEELEEELYDEHEDRKITDEEWEYIRRNYVNKHGGEEMARENFSGKELARFLEPHPLPLFRDCDCSEEVKNGGSSNQ